MLTRLLNYILIEETRYEIYLEHGKRKREYEIKV